MERVAGIEPASSAWKAEVIATIRHPQWWRGWIRTSEALASDLQSDPFGRSGTLPDGLLSYSTKKVELADGIEPPTC